VRWRARWLSEAPRTRTGRLALLPLGLLSAGYAGVTAVHRLLYRRGWLHRRRLSCRVVSVGSPVAGGTGKTPAAAWLATHLHAHGHKVALATRGYGRRGREPVTVLSDGRHVRGRLTQAGDEPVLLVGLAPDVPVLVGPDRGVVGLRAVSQFGSDVLVLDDGMQHDRLARDVEIVTLDGGEGLGNGWVLPRGRLRERAASLGRADAVLVVDGPLSDRDEARLQRHAPGAHRVAARRAPRALRALRDGTTRAPAWLAEREVGMLCGIARPAGFRRTLESLDARIAAERIFPDHHGFAFEDVRDLPREPDTWIVTAKDAVKILPSWLPPGLDLHVLTIALEVDDAEAFLDWLSARLR